MRKGALAVAVLALGGTAMPEETPAWGVHGASASSGASTAQSGTPAASGALDRACVDLLNGNLPPGGEKTASALKSACSELADARAKEKAQRKQAQASGARVQAGQSAAQPQPGASAPAAFAVAGSELVGARPRGAAMGMHRNGEPFGYTVTTNTVGWFSGLGVNAEFLHSFAPDFSWTAGAHYSQTASTDRSLYTLGFMGGFDWFILGQNNAGLRIGPRLDYSFGRELATGTATRSRLGLTGEVGYNFIASNGITAQAGFGLGGRVAGDKNEQLSSAAGGEFGPYVKLGLGYSW